MKQIIDISLDVSKIDKTELYESQKTGKKYLNITLLIRDEKDRYGNDGFVVQKISKSRKDAGEKAPILGNGKIMELDAPKLCKNGPPTSNSYSSQIVGNSDDDLDSIPF